MTSWFFLSSVPSRSSSETTFSERICKRPGHACQAIKKTYSRWTRAVVAANVRFRGNVYWPPPDDEGGCAGRRREPRDRVAGAQRDGGGPARSRRAGAGGGAHAGLPSR